MSRLLMSVFISHGLLKPSKKRSRDRTPVPPDDRLSMRILKLQTPEVSSRAISKLISVCWLASEELDLVTNHLQASLRFYRRHKF